ncbi:hypothetical protein [Nocardioides sp.]|uniref:hypothetical protein n=1 Tax=Nocardioides sp. TaxID=35761 RepID=UPI0035AD9E08
MTGQAGPADARPWTAARRADVVDLFVYVVVLNLAVEHVPSVLSEGFTLSLLTAALLKITLELVIRAKAAAVGRFRAATSLLGRVVSALGVWGLAVGSKLVVLWLIDLAFGGAVSLGGFVSVTLLVLALLMSRRAVRWLLREPLDPDEV